MTKLSKIYMAAKFSFTLEFFSVTIVLLILIFNIILIVSYFNLFINIDVFNILF